MNWIRLTLIKYIDRFRTALLRDVLAMQSLAPLTEGYIPWNAASMRPSSVIVILNEIMFNHRQSILECGSGISTIYIAALLKKYRRAFVHRGKRSGLDQHHPGDIAAQ